MSIEADNELNLKTYQALYNLVWTKKSHIWLFGLIISKLQRNQR